MSGNAAFSCGTSCSPETYPGRISGHYCQTLSDVRRSFPGPASVSMFYSYSGYSREGGDGERGRDQNEKKIPLCVIERELSWYHPTRNSRGCQLLKNPWALARLGEMGRAFIWKFSAISNFYLKTEHTWMCTATSASFLVNPYSVVDWQSTLILKDQLWVPNT